MKKTFRNVTALVLTLIMLTLCLASCGEKAPEKITVEVAIYGLENGADSLWLRDKELEIETGKTAYDAVVALCTARSVTYTEDSSKMFDTFTNEDGLLNVPTQTYSEDGKYVTYYHFGWKLNGEIKSSLDANVNMTDYVLAAGDSIAVYIQADTVSVN